MKDSKELAKELLKFSNDLENEYPLKPAFWHLQELRKKLSQVKNNEGLSHPFHKLMHDSPPQAHLDGTGKEVQN